MVWKMNPRGKTGFRADLSQQPQLHVSASVLALSAFFVCWLHAQPDSEGAAAIPSLILSEEERSRYYWKLSQNYNEELLQNSRSNISSHFIRSVWVT